MNSPTLKEQFYSSSFLISEGQHFFSRDGGYIDNNSGNSISYPAGLVVVQAAAGAVSSAHPTNVGNGTIGVVSTGAGSDLGIYNLVAVSPTQFNLIAPNGDVIGTATVGIAFLGPVNFTITAGGTAFAVGDSFTLTVTQQTASWLSWTGGTITTPIAILYNLININAFSEAQVTLVTRSAEVNLSMIQWDPAVSGSVSAAALQASALAALANVNIIAR